MINSGLFTSNTDEWATPQELFDKLDEEFHFDLDVCASKENAKCKRFFTKEQDGLKQKWGGYTVFCNPPYGRKIKDWVKKCAQHEGTAVMLLPARTDTAWFHDYILGKGEIRFIRRRIHFGGSKYDAPFPSMIVVYRSKKV